MKTRSKKVSHKQVVMIDPLTIAFSKIIEGAKQRVRKSDIPDPIAMASAVREELKKGEKVERRRGSDKLKAIPVEMITFSSDLKQPTTLEPIGVDEARDVKHEARMTEENTASLTAPSANDAKKERAPAIANPELRGTSTVAKPTRLVWTIADRMSARKGGATRGQVLAECQKKGITYYTARTQYQLWKADKEGK